MIKYVQRVDMPSKIHTVHAEPMNSVHNTEGTGYFGLVENVPCMKEMKKVIGEKVLRGEEIILQNGLLVLSLYMTARTRTLHPQGDAGLTG